MNESHLLHSKLLKKKEYDSELIVFFINTKHFKFRLKILKRIKTNNTLVKKTTSLEGNSNAKVFKNKSYFSKIYSIIKKNWTTQLCLQEN